MEPDSKKLREFLMKGDRTFLPHISVDCVIFGFHDNQLKVLLLKWKEVSNGTSFEQSIGQFL